MILIHGTSLRELFDKVSVGSWKEVSWIHKIDRQHSGKYFCSQIIKRPWSWSAIYAKTTATQNGSVATSRDQKM